MPSHTRFRFPALREGNDTLALRPLLIPGMLEPVQDGDGGININVATDDPQGLLCVINPYLPPMKEGDKLEIFWNNENVLERLVTADEVDQRVFFYLPTPTESGWAENCHYVLTRAGETQPDPPSVSLRVLIKLYKPGNRDKAPHLPDGHSELNIVQLPPELVEQGVIDAEWAKNQVPVTIPHYVYCTRGDEVRLKIGDYSLPAHLITQDQADDKQPIEIRIEQEHILRAGDGLKREIKYDINDEVWNWADRHSKRTYIDVDAGGWRLDPPFFKQAVNGRITIKDLNKLPVTVQIHVNAKDFGLGDNVEMTFIGKPPGNAEPIICSATRNIDNIPSVLEIDVPYDLIRALAQGSADASYILYKKDGGDPLSSRRTIASVVGDVNMLPEPTLRELIGDTLEPDEPYATVDVRYAMKNGDLICLRWSGIKSDGDAYPHEVSHIVSDNEAKEGLVTFYINDEHISVLENGTLDLSYVVANDAPGLLDIRESERLLAKVEKIPATLPAPEVEEADPPGDVLDPSKVLDRVHVWISEAKTLKGDVLTYYWRSPNPFASTSDWLPVTTVTEGQPVRFPVDGKFVTANIGNSVRVLYTVWRAATQRNEYSAALDLRVAGWISPTLTDITDSKGIVAPNGTTFDTSVTVTGKASPDQTVELYDGNTALTPVVRVDANGDWNRVISGLSLATHPIKAKALYGAQPVSEVRSFTVASGLKRDFTDFANQNWNGWVGGPGVDNRDLQLRNVGGNWRFHNYTYTENSNGVIIQKTLSNLQPRYQYRFTIKAIRYQGASAMPSLSIRAAGILVDGPTQISSIINWVTLSGTFTPTTSSITVDVYSNVATGVGNDYEIDDIEIVLI
ncbi:hypothetical protein [Pseudomonas sp.]|uniref:hypothetical protein n=1 Tax=Pseudomonas sp. TaxID=306 RepID=UPI003BB599DC